MIRDARWYAKMGFRIVIVGGIAFYVFFQTRGVARGGTVIIETPRPGDSVTEAFVPVRGIAQDIAFLTLNGQQIYTNEAGRFEEKILLAQGYNILTIEARDKFKKAVTIKTAVTYRPEKN